MNERVTPQIDTAGVSQGDSLGIYGSVRQATGEPVPNATVTLADMGGRQIDSVRADAVGNYHLVLMTGGTYLVIAAAPGHEPLVSLVAVGGRSVRQDMTLAGASGLVGTLRLAGSRTPIADATVTVTDIQGSIVGAVKTTAQGAFSFQNLAEGTYTLVIATNTYQPVAFAVDVPQGQLVRRDVELTSTGSISVLVVNAVDDTPFAGASVMVLDQAEQVVAAGTTDSDGGLVFDDLQAGEYTLVANGYGPTALPIRIENGEPQQADLSLAALSSLEEGIAR